MIIGREINEGESKVNAGSARILRIKKSFQVLPFRILYLDTPKNTQ